MSGPSTSTSPLDQEYDVVVVGFGPAGAAAAIAASDAGASVLVLEAAPQGGGNAVYSGGFLFDVPDPWLIEHLAALSFGRTPRDVLAAYASGLHQVSSWLGSLGGSTIAFEPPATRWPAPFPSWPSFPAGAQIEYRVVDGGPGRRGAALWDLLDRAVAARRIDVRCATPAVRLVAEAEADGDAVVGVVAMVDGELQEIRAAGGVVLASGGFEADPALTDAYLPLGPTWPVGTPFNDGAGLRMAQTMGADLWHMYGFFGWFAFRTKEFAAPFAIDFFAPGHVFVDAEGRRFADETGFEVHDRLRSLLGYLPRNPNRPALPAWAIFDEPTRRAAPLNGLLGTPNDYRWSPDNNAEVDRGWIIRAGTATELAARMGVEGSTLVATLEEYDRFARSGRDDRFGRAAETLVPLAPGPLYAIPTWPGIAGTTGGPRHDPAGRVLRPGGSVVPGLYAAGAVSLVWGHLIDHGGGLTDAIVFGRAAGADAAARAAQQRRPVVTD